MDHIHFKEPGLPQELPPTSEDFRAVKILNSVPLPLPLTPWLQPIITESSSTWEAGNANDYWLSLLKSCSLPTLQGKEADVPAAGEEHGQLCPRSYRTNQNAMWEGMCPVGPKLCIPTTHCSTLTVDMVAELLSGHWQEPGKSFNFQARETRLPGQSD